MTFATALSPARHDQAAFSRSGVAAAVFGNMLEFYDFTVYAFFAVWIGKAFFPTQDAFSSLLLSVATFGVGFFTRPLGAAYIGAYADRAGRKPAMMLTILLMSLGTLVLAVTPRLRHHRPRGSRDRGTGASDPRPSRLAATSVRQARS